MATRTNHPCDIAVDSQEGESIFIYNNKKASSLWGTCLLKGAIKSECFSFDTFGALERLSGARPSQKL